MGLQWDAYHLPTGYKGHPPWQPPQAPQPAGRSQKLAVPKRGRGQLLLYRRFKVPPAAPGTFGRLHW